MGRGRVERDRVAGSQLVLLEPELDAEPSREHVAVLATGMPHESLVGGRRSADVVDHVEEVDVLVLVARQPLPDDPGVQLDANTLRDYNIEAAIALVTLKLVGYVAVVSALAERFHDDSAILIFGGLAKESPYPGGMTVTTINHGVDGLVRALTSELKPIRVNALHPGIVEDSPFWAGKTEALDAHRARTMTGRLVRMREVVDAAVFMLENPSVAGTELRVDGGWSLPR